MLHRFKRYESISLLGIDMTVEVDISPTKADLAKAKTKMEVYESDLDENSKKLKDVWENADKPMDRDLAFVTGGAVMMLIVQSLEIFKKYRDAMKEYIGLLEKRNGELEKFIPKGNIEEK